MGSLRSLHTQGHAERVQEDIDKAFDMWAHDGQDARDTALSRSKD
jgi:hypothetical protein